MEGTVGAGIKLSFKAWLGPLLTMHVQTGSLTSELVFPLSQSAKKNNIYIPGELPVLNGMICVTCLIECVTPSTRCLSNELSLLPYLQWLHTGGNLIQVTQRDVGNYQIHSTIHWPALFHFVQHLFQVSTSLASNIFFQDCKPKSVQRPAKLH